MAYHRQMVSIYIYSQYVPQDNRLLNVRLCSGVVFIKMCYRLIVVLLLGLAGLLCYSDCVQAEDVTFDPDHIG